MRIALVGDIAVFENGLLKTDFKKGLLNISEYLGSHDIVIGNLEVPITERKRTMVCKGMHLKTQDKILEILKYLNINCVCLANNHVYDFGEKGLMDTIEVLRKNKISFYGINGEKEYIEGDEKIALSGFCCFSTNGSHYKYGLRKKGVNVLSKENIYKSLSEDKRLGYYSIVSMHWGDEYSQLPNEKQVLFFEKMCKWNNLILHGHHTHVMQGIIKHDNSIAAFNQGNFCFDECQSPVNPKLLIKQSPLNKESFILSVDIKHGTIQSCKTTGIYYDNFSIKIIDNRSKIDSLSARIQDCHKEEYKIESKRMIASQKEKNLQNKDFKWLLSKLNYYSIGAKIGSYKNGYLYKKAY